MAAKYKKSLHFFLVMVESPVRFCQNDGVPSTYDSLLFDTAMIKCPCVTATSTFLQLIKEPEEKNEMISKLKYSKVRENFSPSKRSIMSTSNMESS